MLNNKSKEIKTKIIPAVTLFLMMLVPGCGGPSPREIGEISLALSLGIVTISIPVIMLLSWLAGTNLFRSKKVWMQFAGLAVICISLYLFYGDFGWQGLHITAFLGLISVPYLFLVTSLAVSLLPARFLKFLPVLVLTPHFLISIMLVLTDSDNVLAVFPIMLSLQFWPLSIGITFCIIVYLIAKKIVNKRKRESDQKIS